MKMGMGMEVKRVAKFNSTARGRFDEQRRVMSPLSKRQRYCSEHSSGAQLQVESY